MITENQRAIEKRLVDLLASIQTELQKIQKTRAEKILADHHFGGTDLDIPDEKVMNTLLDVSPKDIVDRLYMKYEQSNDAQGETHPGLETTYQSLMEILSSMRLETRDKSNLTEFPTQSTELLGDKSSSTLSQPKHNFNMPFVHGADKGRTYDSPRVLFDLPNEVLEKIIFLLPFKDIVNLMSASEELMRRIWPSFYRLAPLHMILPCRESYNSKNYNYPIRAYLEDQKNYEEHYFLKQPRVLIVSNDFKNLNSIDRFVRGFKRDTFDCELLKNATQWRKQSESNTLSYWSKSVIFISNLSNLKILKIQIYDLKMLMLCIKFLPQSLVSFIVEINSRHLVCDNNARNLLKNTTFQIAHENTKLRYLSISKTKGRPLIEAQANLLSLLFERRGYGNEGLTIESIRSQQLERIEGSLSAIESAPLASCLGLIVRSLILANRETLEVIDISNIDSIIIFKRDSSLIKVNFPRLFALNVCYVSLPLLNAWLPLVIENNSEKKRRGPYSPKYPESYYTSTYIRAQEVLYADLGGLELCKKWGGEDTRITKGSTDLCKQWYVQYGIDKYLLLK